MDAVSPPNVVRMKINVIATVVAMATLISDPHYLHHCRVCVCACVKLLD